MKFPLIENMHWVKTLPKDIINLSTSGVTGPEGFAELGIDPHKLPIHGNNYYGYKPLREMLAHTYGVKPCNVAITPGASMANYVIMACLLDPEKEVLIETPIYEPMLRVAEHFSQTPVAWLRRQIDDYWRLSNLIDSEQIRKDKCDLLVLTNPHNPTGAVDSLDTIARLTEMTGGWTLVDEIYMPFLENGERQTAAVLHERIISVGSLTKVWGLSGLRIGWIIADAELIERFLLFMDYMHVNQPIITEAIAFEALSEGGKGNELIRCARQLSQENWQIMEAFLKQTPELVWTKPEAGITVLVKLADGRNSDEFYDCLFNKYQTAAMPGKYFGVPDGIRLSFGRPKEELERGLDAVRKALKDVY